MLTGDPAAPAIFTRCTSVPLIHATKPSSTIAPNCSDSTSETFVITNVFRRKKHPYTFCIPLICVPPGKTSPYQNGAGTVVNSASANPASLHPPTGVEASVSPVRQRQFDARSNNISPCTERLARNSSTKRNNKPLNLKAPV